MLTQAALAEVQKIAPAGMRVTPSDLVAQARSPNSALHQYFDWNDGRAAVAFRLIQARQVLKTVARVLPARVHPLVHVAVTHHPVAPIPVQRFVAAAAPDPARLEVLRTRLVSFQGEFAVDPGFDRIFEQMLAAIDKHLPRRPMFGGATRQDNPSSVPVSFADLMEDEAAPETPPIITPLPAPARTLPTPDVITSSRHHVITAPVRPDLTPAKPAPQIKLRDTERQAREIYAQLAPSERKMLAYLPGDGSRRAVSGVGMEMLIRYLWQKFPDAKLVSAEVIDGVNMARLEAAGKLIRGLATRGG